jgi:RHH-type transcriptional regulator, rel operon repressor / antitoxin RelB
MADTITSIRLSDELRSKIERLARATGRSKSFLMQEAIAQYVENESWQITEIEEGLRADDAGELVPAAEMEAFWARVTTPESMARAERRITDDALRQSNGSIPAS